MTIYLNKIIDPLSKVHNFIFELDMESLITYQNNQHMDQVLTKNNSKKHEPKLGYDYAIASCISPSE